MHIIDIMPIIMPISTRIMPIVPIMPSTTRRMLSRCWSLCVDFNGGRSLCGGPFLRGITRGNGYGDAGGRCGYDGGDEDGDDIMPLLSIILHYYMTMI